MAAFRFAVAIMPREGMLDPQGKAVEAALPQLGAASVHGVRIGRRIELTVEAEDAGSARGAVDALAADFLSNPLIESWSIEALEPAAQAVPA